jgi:hypothetical protein
MTTGEDGISSQGKADDECRRKYLMFVQERRSHNNCGRLCEGFGKRGESDSKQHHG